MQADHRATVPGLIAQQQARNAGATVAVGDAEKAVRRIPISDTTAPIRQRVLADLEALRVELLEQERRGA